MSLDKNCNICGKKNIEEVLVFGNLPTTGVYRKKEDKMQIREYDQSLLYCDNCKHLKLSNILDSEDLYSDTYSFRTSQSNTAKKASDFFINFVKKTFNGLPFKNIVEFGCNDGYALKKIKSDNSTLLGVDMIWAGKENQFDDPEINISGKMIEDVDFSDYFGEEKPDFIYACHTMEHITNPINLLKKLYEKTEDNTVFALEFPCFDVLFENMRFDQIFHQHINYFTKNSVKNMLDLLGAELINYTINYNHWGAIIVLFKRNGNIEKNNLLLTETIGKKQIISKYDIFQKQMKMTSSLIKESGKNIYGYGAALMLPVLAYHLGITLEELSGVIDDDKNKIGMSYLNLPVTIVSSDNIDFSKTTILLTAIDNRRVIVKHLYNLLPKRIINPLPVL